jgi:hypothetical protein
MRLLRRTPSDGSCCTTSDSGAYPLRPIRSECADGSEHPTVGRYGAQLLVSAARLWRREGGAGEHARGADGGGWAPEMNGAGHRTAQRPARRTPESHRRPVS